MEKSDEIKTALWQDTMAIDFTAEIQIETVRMTNFLD